MINSDHREFYVLDGIRGLAALGVCLYHVVGGAYIHRGYLAVDVFFIMSGFVLAAAYERRLNDGMGLLRFMCLRLIRLYPLYLLSLSISVIAAAFGVGVPNVAQWGRDAVLNLLFLPTISSGHLFPMNPPGWTLFFELVVNIAYVAVLPWLTTHRLVIGVALFAAAAGVIAISRHKLGGGGAWSAVDIALARVMFGFFAGVMLYRLRDVWRWPSVSALVVLAGVAAVLLAPAGGGLRRAAWDWISVVAIAPALVALGVRARGSRWMAAVFRWAGEISYGVYVLHFPILYLFLAALQRVGWSMNLWTTLLFTAMVVGLAYISYVAFDVPLRSWLTRRIVISQQPRPGGQMG